MTNDEQRRRDLRQMRIVATALLAFAAVIYALTSGDDGALGYLNAAAEAAIIGALADWFAVTALFRRPLGLPIPHTALIDRRKDSLALSLQEFVSGHFLTAEAIVQRYRDADVTRRLGALLAEQRHATRITAEGARITRQMLAKIRDDEISLLLTDLLLPRLKREPLAPLAGALLDQIVIDDAHRPLVDLVCDELTAWLEDNEATVIAVLTDRAPSWAPRWLNTIVTDRVHSEIVAWMRAIRDTPDHKVRRAVDDLLADLATNLQYDPLTRERAEALIDRWLTHPQTLASAMSIATIARATLDAALADSDGYLHRRLREEVMALGTNILDDDDPALRARIDEDVEAAIGFAIAGYGGELAEVISAVIARWDGRQASERIELHVGRDLQFIRINGTIVGGLAGLLIHALGQLLL